MTNLVQKHQHPAFISGENVDHFTAISLFVSVKSALSLSYKLYDFELLTQCKQKICVLLVFMFHNTTCARFLYVYT